LLQEEALILKEFSDLNVSQNPRNKGTLDKDNGMVVMVR
jgi:hypothetical protein